MYHEGKFREDLYYRLKRLYLKTPPLRSRLEDIDELVRYFLAKNHRPDLVISNEVRNILTTHNWPGNIRELESTIEYMVAVCDVSTINRDCLPQDFFNSMTTSSFDNIAEKLSTKGALPEFLFIMRTLYEYNSLGKSIGRKKISALTQNFDYLMTEEQIRKRTDILMDLDLLVKTRGRTGMLLSMKGKNYIEDKLY
jgi:transcriptional regulator with PAS, ATPase and Fis domain